MNRQTCTALASRAVSTHKCVHTHVPTSLLSPINSTHRMSKEGGSWCARSHLIGQAKQLQCTPFLGPVPEYASCAKNGVEDKKFIFSKSWSCMGSGRRRVVRASEPIHDPLPPPPLICMLLCALATPCNNMQLRVEKKAHLQWFCAHTHMFNVTSRNAHCLSQPHNTHLVFVVDVQHMLLTPHARGQHSNTHNAAGPNRLAHTHAITWSLPIQLVVPTVGVYEERRKKCC